MANGDYSTDSRLARVEQRVSDLDVRVTALVPLMASVLTLTERVDTIRRDLAVYASQVSKLDDEIEQRERSSRQERRQTRLAMWTLTVMILAALIGAAAVVLTSGAHP